MTVVLLFVLLFLLIALGLPIALSIGIPAVGLMLTPGVFPASVHIAALGQTIVQLLFAGVDSFDLLAVPLFMLAGAIMETGGISRQLIDFSDSLVGWLPGGLACACIVASMFFAGISGSAAADTAAIGAVIIFLFKTYFWAYLSDYQVLYLIILGGVIAASVVFLPNGLWGTITSYLQSRKALKSVPVSPAAAEKGAPHD